MTPVDVTLDGQITFGPLEPKPLERLRRALSFRNPEFAMMQRLGKYTDHLPDRIYALVELPNGGAVIPRGAWALAKKTLLEHGVQPTVTADHRSPGVPILHSGEVLRLGLRDYQQQGIAALLKHLQGIVVLPCGVGKSRLGVGAIVSAGISSIVLVHTGDLSDQWVSGLAEIGILAGRIDADHRDFLHPVVVATVQSLYSLLQTDRAATEEWLRTFGLCIQDEVHHCPARTLQEVLNAIPARLRLGLTATPDREDGYTKIMDWSFGPRLLERTTEEMIRLGWLMKAEIEFIETDFTFSYQGPDEKRLATLDKAIVNDEARNILIADLAAREGNAGETVLVLSNRKPHCRALAKMICDRGVHAEAVIGTTGKGKRKDTIRALRGGELRVMVATSLADEGLDVQRLSRVILAWPQRAAGGTTQRVGRLLRDFAKKPKLYDLVDAKVDTLASRAAARRTVYRKMGLLPKERRTMRKAKELLRILSKTFPPSAGLVFDTKDQCLVLQLATQGQPLSFSLDAEEETKEATEIAGDALDLVSLYEPTDPKSKIPRVNMFSLNRTPTIPGPTALGIKETTARLKEASALFANRETCPVCEEVDPERAFLLGVHAIAIMVAANQAEDYRDVFCGLHSGLFVRIRQIMDFSIQEQGGSRTAKSKGES